jgi:hypothetical protein
VARRLLAIVVAALVLFEGAGVARALTSAEAIECCCGRHDAHRACKCKACPILKKRAHAATTRLEVGRDCHGQEDPGALSVVAVMPPPAPSLAALDVAAVAEGVVAPLDDRLPEAGRPPP